jgi:hypothetical protein
MVLVLLTTISKAQWSEIPALPIIANWPMTAELDGKIYSFGGIDGTASRNVYVYTPGATEWEKLSGLMPKGKFGGYAAAINGKIYIVGGMVVSGNSYVSNGETYEFDPVARTFTTKKALTTATKVGWFAGAQVNGKIYVIGGYTGSTDVTNIQVYDPATDTWTTSTSKAPYTGRYAASAVLNGKIFVMGGNSTTSYLNQAWMGTPNDADGTIAWEKIANLPAALTRGSAGVANGKVTFTGGAPVLSEGYSNTYIYNQANDEWETSYALPASTYNAGQLFGTGNDLYFIGGYQSDKSFKFTASDTQLPSANIPVTPIFSNLAQQQVFISEFAVQNLGVAPLTVEISIPASASAWLTTGGANGTVDQLMTEHFSLNLISGSLAPGLYKADVTITTNDPAHTTTLLPVMLYVLPQGVTLQETKVVVEEGTGDWCGWCPSGHEVMIGIEDEQGEKVIPLAYHGGSSTEPFRFTEGLALLSNLQIQGYPNASIQRWMFPGESYQMTNRDKWPSYVQSVLDQTPHAPISLKVISYNYNPSTRQVTAKIELERSLAQIYDPSTSVHLTAIVTESGLIYRQVDYVNGDHPEYIHNNTVRQMHPDEMGEQANLAATTIIEGGIVAPGDKVTMDVNFTVIDSLVDANNCDIIFVANSVTGGTLGPILQGSKMKLVGSFGAVKTSDVASNVSVTNFPNPVAKTTTFTYAVTEPTVVSLAVYDVMGREVANVISNESHSTGTYETDLNASKLSNGAYTYVLTAGAQKVSGTMLVQK